MTLTELLNTATRARSTARGARPRPLALLLRYAVLGAVALSILPASAAQLAVAAQEKSQGNTESKSAAEQHGQNETPGVVSPDLRVAPQVNVASFEALLSKGEALYRAGQLKAPDTLDATAEADVLDDGRLTNLVLKGLPAADPAFNELARDFVAALSTSGVLSAFPELHHLTLRLALDRQHVVGTAHTDLETEQRAQLAAQVWSTGLVYQRFNTRGKAAQVVWNNMTASASGKQLALKLEMTRADAGNLLLRQITPN